MKKDPTPAVARVGFFMYLYGVLGRAPETKGEEIRGRLSRTHACLKKIYEQTVACDAIVMYL